MYNKSIQIEYYTIKSVKWTILLFSFRKFLENEGFRLISLQYSTVIYIRIQYTVYTLYSHGLLEKYRVVVHDTVYCTVYAFHFYSEYCHQTYSTVRALYSSICYYMLRSM